MTASTDDRHFRVYFWPAKPYGRWSLGSAVAVVLGQIFLWLAVVSGQDRGVEGAFFDNWWLAGPALLMVVGGLSALASGVLSILRERDRSIGVMLSTLIGMLVALFLVFAE